MPWGGVFGVGFFREYYTRHSKRRRAYVMKHAGKTKNWAEDRPRREELRRRKLVRRSHFSTIIAAWVVTVPAAALLSAVVFYGLSQLR